jgi:heptose I phosphotransferase
MRETLWQRLALGARRVCQRPDWTDFVSADWADRIMAVTVTDRFHAKQGRSTGRWVLWANGQRMSVYLKRHYLLPWWRGWLAAVWPNRGWSPALQEWRHLEWARSRGVPVPRAVAAAEYIGPWGRLQSFLAVEELSGMVPLHEAVPRVAARLDETAFRKWKRGLAIELAYLARILHEHRRFHKDLYLCHLFIPEDLTLGVPDWSGRVHLIDLHRLKRHPYLGLVWQIKDLAQLLYSSEVAGLDARDRLRFWRAYWGDRRHGWSVKLLRRFICYKAWRYRRHNLKRSKPRNAMGSSGCADRDFSNGSLPSK